MVKKQLKKGKTPAAASAGPVQGDCFLRKALAWGMGVLGVLVSVSFFNGTFDNAQVKITLLHLGGTALCAWWLALLVQEKRCIFTKQNWTLYLPFLCYYGWNLLTFLFAPYPAEGSDEFIRCAFYFLLTLCVLSQLRLAAARVFAKCVVAAAWISFAYGLLQVADHFLPGADFMPWRGFFAGRVFSTHANPNFFGDFIVFSGAVIAAEYLRTRSKKLLFLGLLGLINLFFTESKGAWLGMAASAVFFVGVYANTLAAGIKRQLKKLNLSAAVLLAGVLLLTGVYAAKRFQSVSFRLHTWSAAAQMTLDSPFMGTGIGSFKVIYPAYRKPQIFYIENAHNTETQHAENEYLEQWATIGTVGLSLFLWLAFFVLAFGIKNLRRIGAPGERAYLLLGYVTAFFGILVHNFFDISMRFVSTGFFFAVFSAFVVVLGAYREEDASLCAVGDGTVHPLVPSNRPWVLWGGKAAFLVAAALTLWVIGKGFAQTASPVFSATLGGTCLRLAAWGVFVGTACAVFYVYGRAVWRSRTLRLVVVLLLSLWPMTYFFRSFMANHYYGVATALAGRNNLDGALAYYQKAILANPFVAEYYQHRANILRAQLDLTASFQPSKGDTDGPLNDYQRIERDLTAVRRLAPNHALLQQTEGEFYYAAALKYTQLAMESKGEYEYTRYRTQAMENMERAKTAFERALLTDPVNDRTYAHLISIALMERNAASARKWINAYKQGPQGVTEPEFLQRHRQNAFILQQEENANRMFGWGISTTVKTKN